MDVCTQMRGRSVEMGEEIEGLATEVDMKSSSRELFERAPSGSNPRERKRMAQTRTGREVCSKRAAGSIIDLNY
jgi:hypothetical protein